MMRKGVFSMMRLLMLAACLFLSATQHLDAAQQYQGLCSYVKMEILQELSMERIGFLATLEVTNNEGDASITDFAAALTFKQQPLAPGDEPSEASDLFFVQPPELEGISAIDGTGIIRPGETAIIRWFIIPKVTAGGAEPIGLQYLVGAGLGGSIYGLQIAPEVLAVIPDTITVKPEPRLEITYFQPRDVDGDNPFTPDVVEAPVPFTLGVLVKNTGYGRATSVRVDSEQPRIVEDLQGLQVIPRLLGTRVDDEPTDHSSMTLVLGDIEPGRCRKGAWDMITTLSGEFTAFNASYTHASELGGRDTSVIADVNAYFIAHEVLNDQPGRDGLLDFLADTTDDPEMIPDMLYESDCVTTPVNRLSNVDVLEYSNKVATLHAVADFENWVYMRLDDPAQARYPIASVIRSDGKVLNPHNYWTNVRYREPDNARLTYLNIFDFVSLGDYQYTVTYEQPGADTEPPVTKLLFSGPKEEREGKYYILPETQILFLAEDDSPVGTYYKLDDAADFVPALPFTIPDAGEHALVYYSQDFEGNTESEHLAAIVVSAEDPAVENVTTDTQEFFNTGGSVSVRPTSITIGFSGEMTAATLNAEVDVFHYPVEKRVRHENLGQVDGNVTEFVWDGRDDDGGLVPPGWYTVRITVTDGLGRSGSSDTLVYVGDLVADGSVLSDAGNAGQNEAHAFGRWVVWQDQRNGDWDIYALDLMLETGTAVPVRVAPMNQERPRTDGTYVVWEDRQTDGTWDIWARKLGAADAAFPITSTLGVNERRPTVDWPWVVYQAQPASDPGAPWQVMAYNAVDGSVEVIDPTAQDQLDPWVHRQRVVWQDFRDPGAGEIYFKDLKTGDVRRITNDPGGQYHPVIQEQWIVWADNRNTQLDLYGYNLLRLTEVQLTDTPEDEARPMINGKWVVCSEDSAAEAHTNLRIVSLSNLAAIQMTKTASEKEKPCMASGKLIWTDSVDSRKRIMAGTMPDLQPVFNNQNTVAVTEGMASGLQDAFALLELWHREAGVAAITRYTSLVPTVESETAAWDGGGPAGDNFTLESGTFLWVRFSQAHILDLGRGSCDSLDLGVGVNVLTYTCFPDQYSAYKLINAIGKPNISGLRLLDADTGRWRTAAIVGDKIVGENFVIPRIAVLMMDMKNAVAGWKPGE